GHAVSHRRLGIRSEAAGAGKVVQGGALSRPLHHATRGPPPPLRGGGSRSWCRQRHRPSAEVDWVLPPVTTGEGDQRSWWRGRSRTPPHRRHSNQVVFGYWYLRATSSFSSSPIPGRSLTLMWPFWMMLPPSVTVLQ